MAETLRSNHKPLEDPTAVPESASSVKVPLIIILISVTMFLPEEASFSLGEMRLTVTRLLLLLIAPITLFRFGQLMAGGCYRFVWSDLLVPATGLWMFVGPIANDEFSDAIKASGSAALEFCLPYMAARVFLSERGQAVALVRILCIVIAIVGWFALVDEVWGRWVIRDLVGSFTGYIKPGFDPAASEVDPRGFRATSTLEHPILLGTACFVGLLLSTITRGFLRLFVVVGCVLGLGFAKSSAALLGTVIGFSAIFYERVTRNLPFRWAPLTIGASLVLSIIFIVHPSPFGFIFEHLTFDPESAWYRLLQWDCAGGLVLESPFVGIGLSDEWANYCELSNTIDSFWLRNAMMYGILGSVLIFLSFVGSASIPVGVRDNSINLTSLERQLTFILNLVIVILIFIGFTVFFWGTDFVLMMFLAGIRAHLGALGALPPALDLGD